MSLPELVADLGIRIGEATFAFVDLETTDLFLVGSDGPHRIIEVGAVLTDDRGTVLDSFSSLVNPERSIPAEASAVHGLTDAHVAEAPLWAEIQPRLLDFLARASMVFGYNSPFDLRFIVHEMLLLDIVPPRMEFYDVARMANRAGFGRGSLVDLFCSLEAKRSGDGAYGGTPTGGMSINSGELIIGIRQTEAVEVARTEHSAHRALGDAERTGTCMAALLELGYGGDESLAAIKTTHDSTVPVYDTQRCLDGLEAARRRRPGQRTGVGKARIPDRTVCVTGKLDGMPRTEVKKRLAQVGFKYVAEASGGPEFVVVGERPTDRKLMDAMQANVPLMDGQQFLHWLKASETVSALQP